MKTWHRFLASLSNKLIIAGALGLPLISHAQSGFYSNFQTLIDIHEDNFGKKLEKYASSPSNLEDMANPSEADLDPDFLSSLIFHTPARYAGLGGGDRCGLYDLILSNLAQGPNGDLKTFLIRYKTKGGQVKTVAVDRKTFFEKVAFPVCPEVERFQKYFNLKNLPTTLKNISLNPPSTQAECEQAHDRFRNDPKTPYLCYLSEEIQGIQETENEIRTTSGSNYRKLRVLRSKLKAAKKYSSLVNPAAQSYLSDLCLNIDSRKAFCEGFFQTNFWQRIVSGEKSDHYMRHSCQELLEKNKLSKKDYAVCAKKFSAQPDLCSQLGGIKGDLTPKADCDALSENLNLSRLKADYSDCPAKVGNAAVVNVARLVTHFSGDSPPKSPYCHAAQTAVFAGFDQETSEGRFWDVKLCFDDKVNRKEVCLPAVYGKVEGSEFSLDAVVEKILRKSKGLGSDQSCEIVGENDYRPELLKFKSGCFIVVAFDECHGVSCKYDILLDRRKMEHIKQRTGTSFDYFPKDFANENFAMAEQLAKKYKLKNVRVLNVSSLKRILDKHAEALAHGVACAEDLLPEHFAKRTVNQCSPLPFIVDGYKEKNGVFSVVARTGYDSIHAPRMIPWTSLFSALKDYQRLHPLSIWGLHALYK